VWFRNIRKLQYFRAAKLMNEDRLHDLSSRGFRLQAEVGRGH
jgi:hypothetical protein